jgi:succinyl-CoA synthetase beta subunit
MATMDMVATLGGSVRCLVDFGGAIFRAADALTPILAAVASLQPRAILVNCFLQVARCDALAEAIAEALRGRLAPAAVVLRLRGNGAAEARALLAPLGFGVTEDLQVAARAAVDGARRAARR